MNPRPLKIMCVFAVLSFASCGQKEQAKTAEIEKLGSKRPRTVLVTERSRTLSQKPEPVRVDGLNVRLTFEKSTEENQ